MTIPVICAVLYIDYMQDSRSKMPQIRGISPISSKIFLSFSVKRPQNQSILGRKCLIQPTQNAAPDDRFFLQRKQPKTVFKMIEMVCIFDTKITSHTKSQKWLQRVAVFRNIAKILQNNFLGKLGIGGKLNSFFSLLSETLC